MTARSQLTFFEHLNELRNRLFIVLAAVCAGTAVAYFYSDKVLSILIGPLKPEMNQIYFFSPAEAFLVKLKIAFLCGIFLTSPVILVQIWKFVAPALYHKEKRIVLPLILVMSILFSAGALFCFRFVMPVALQFLIGMQSEYVRPMISLTHYMDFLFGMLLGFGAAFNMPVLILMLVLAGFLKTATLQKYQRHMIVLIFIIAAVLTPSPDVASQVLLAVPLLILFELSVVGAWVIERLRKKPLRVPARINE